MKKINILKKSMDFTRIIQQQTPKKSKYFIIYKENTKDIYHFGISVSKKIGNAVVRNKYKRQIKSILDKKDYKKGFNCIIIVRRGVLDSTYQQMEEVLLKELSILHLFDKGESYE